MIQRAKAKEAMQKERKRARIASITPRSNES
jgi:hypothetical protein